MSLRRYARLSPERVLVVDDNHDVRESRHQLPAGFDAHSASDEAARHELFGCPTALCLKSCSPTSTGRGRMHYARTRDRECTIVS